MLDPKIILSYLNRLYQFLSYFNFPLQLYFIQFFLNFFLIQILLNHYLNCFQEFFNSNLIILIKFTHYLIYNLTLSFYLYTQNVKHSFLN